MIKLLNPYTIHFSGNKNHNYILRWRGALAEHVSPQSSIAFFNCGEYIYVRTRFCENQRPQIQVLISVLFIIPAFYKCIARVRTREISTHALVYTPVILDGPRFRKLQEDRSQRFKRSAESLINNKIWLKYI